MSEATKTDAHSLEVAELEIERLPLSEVTPHSRIHTEEQVVEIKTPRLSSIERNRRDGAILFGHINGDDINVLSGTHNLSKQQIYSILRSQGVRILKDRTERDKHIVDLHRKGGSTKAIAEELGVTYSLVYAVLRKEGYRQLFTDRACGVCGFTFTPKAKNHLLCSDDCRSEDKRRDSKIRRHTDPGIWKKCKYCDRSFKAKGRAKERQECCNHSCATSFVLRKHIPKGRDEEIYYLRHIQGLSFRRIGEIFGIHQATARHAFRRQRLQQNLRLAGMMG